MSFRPEGEILYVILIAWWRFLPPVEMTFFLLIVNNHQLGLIMTYKLSDITEEAILIILSIVPIGICLSIFISDGWTTPILAFFISAFSFYCTRSIYRKNKIRIKELSNINDTIKFSFFIKSKHPLVLKKANCNISTSETSNFHQ